MQGFSFENFGWGTTSPFLIRNSGGFVLPFLDPDLSKGSYVITPVGLSVRPSQRLSISFF